MFQIADSKSCWVSCNIYFLQRKSNSQILNLGDFSYTLNDLCNDLKYFSSSSLITRIPFSSKQTSGNIWMENKRFIGFSCFTLYWKHCQERSVNKKKLMNRRKLTILCQRLMTQNPWPWWIRVQLVAWHTHNSNRH